MKSLNLLFRHTQKGRLFNRESPIRQSSFRRTAATTKQRTIVCWFCTTSGDKGGGNAEGGNNIRYLKIYSSNPFEVLGIPKQSTYEGVKRRFIELALKHHPDVLSSDGDDNNSEEEKKQNVEEFIRLRKAFEAIRESSDGTTRLVEEGDASSWTDDNFQAWFYEETGHQDVMFKMDFGTRKEVIDIANNQSQGGLDKGGMWEMARTMAQQEENLKKKKHQHSKSSSVGLNSGPKQETTNSPRRRRRKK